MTVNPAGLAAFNAWAPVLIVVIGTGLIVLWIFTIVLLYFQSNRNYNSALAKYFSYFKKYEPSKPPRTSAARSRVQP